ncbi:MAG: hypothetical protein ACAH59_09785 [Pseudobdellovibrionaceae bacterium]
MARWISIFILFLLAFELSDPSSNFIRASAPAAQEESLPSSDSLPPIADQAPVHACEAASFFLFVSQELIFLKPSLFEFLGISDGIPPSIFHPPKLG